jgi:sirohydrochlorin cobaltochelatase
MKKAILLVSFGTSYKNARENSIDKIYEDIVGMSNGIPVYQAYTSGKIIKKLANEGIRIYNIDEAVSKAISDGIEEMYVVSTHIIPGHEYNKLCAMLEKYRESFTKLCITTPVLNTKEDCAKTALLMNEILKFDKDTAYVLMGHGTDAEANIRYIQMNEVFVNNGFDNVVIASVEENPNIYDAVEYMQKKSVSKNVVLHPFMLVAGDHAVNDMAGEGDSFVNVLKENGFETVAVLKGLGEYPLFRKIFTDKLKEMIG